MLGVWWAISWSIDAGLLALLPDRWAFALDARLVRRNHGL